MARRNLNGASQGVPSRITEARNKKISLTHNRLYLQIENLFMKHLLWFFQRLYFIYAFSIFLFVMLLLVPFMALASLWGKVRGGNIVYRFCNLWADICFPLIFIFSRRKFEAPHDDNKAYIFVATHQS